MPTEHTDLGIHVSLCAERYDRMNEKLGNMESRMNNLEQKVEKIREEINSNQKSITKVVIGTAGTIIASILSLVIVLVIKL